MPEKAEPRFLRQSSGGPPSGQAVSRPLSADTPSRLGPMYWGQSATAANAGAISSAPSAIQR